MRHSRALAPASVVALLLSAAPDAAEVGRETLLSAEESIPWRGVGRVNIGGIGQRSSCTGALIEPDLVLTAAHCVTDHATGDPRPAGAVHFVAGWHKGEMTGHSPGADIVVSPEYDPGSRRTAPDIATDMALMRLAKPIPSESARPFGIAPPPPPGASVAVISYRRDRAHALTYQDDCDYRRLEGPLLVLGCDVTTGASGAPVFAEVDGEPRIVGTLVAVARSPGGTTAVAVRADAAVAALRSLLQE